MGTKRSYDDVESDIEASDSSSEQASKRTKHQDKEGTLGRSKSKKRVRTIRKQLQQDDDLAADVRLELERELAVHEAAIAEQEFYKKRAAMIAKYHKARFFERKKAMRLAKRLKKRLDKATDAKEIERLRHQLHVAEVDEAYAQHFPHSEPYINLYAKSKSKSEPEEEEEDTSAGETVLGTERPSIWTTIEEAMKEGPQALKKIRERRPVEEQATTEPREAQKEEKLTVPPQSRKGATSVPPNKSDKYPPVRPPAVVQKPGQNGKAPAMNRRERRRLMREAAAKSGEDKNEGESFFE